jgi:hypothetical protein
MAVTTAPAPVAGQDEVGAVVLGAHHQWLDDAVGGDAGHDVRHVADAPAPVFGGGRDRLGGKVLVHGFSLFVDGSAVIASRARQLSSQGGSMGEVEHRPRPSAPAVMATP